MYNDYVPSTEVNHIIRQIMYYLVTSVCPVTLENQFLLVAIVENGRHRTL